MGAVAFIQDEAEFDSLLAGDPDKVLVVDFTAEWCGPCTRVAPMMEQLVDDYGDRVKVFKLDVDVNKPISKRLNIRGIPAVIMFKGGETVERIVGAKPYEMFTEAVDKHV